jgi:SAM-dependent methyltransferase
VIPYQKVCDIYDFFDPDLEAIMRGPLEATPFGSRRLWEFAMNFRALRDRGALRPDATGLALGAGTERLIYAVAPRVGRLIVTDLYEPGSRWTGVRTDNPIDLLRARAPWPLDWDRIEARRMDMRAIDLPDASVDFCWSTGSFEHIGDEADFARHFAEVHRVLKPGGVYAFTTAVCFTGASEPIPHNWYFDPGHLVALANASPLRPEPVFDCTVRDHILNHPHPERMQDYGFAAAGIFSRPLISLRRGVVLTANSLLLTRDDAAAAEPCRVIGFEATRRRLLREAAAYVGRLWSEFQGLRLEPEGDGLKAQPQQFGEGPVEAAVGAVGGARGRAVLRVLSRPVSRDYRWRPVAREAFALSAERRIVFRAEADRLYQFRLDLPDPALAERVTLRARRLPAA